MKKFKELREMVAVGGGAIAGVGQPPGSQSGEPGVKLPRKRKKDPILLHMSRRKPM